MIRPSGGGGTPTTTPTITPIPPTPTSTPVGPTATPVGGSAPPAYDMSMTYDALGNLRSDALQRVATHATGAGTGTGPHQARTVNGASYSYDLNGNLLSGGGRSYTWTPENLPATSTTSSGTESYTYDADGERVVRVAGGVTTAYFEGLWEQTTAGAWKTYYTFNGQVVALRDSATNAVTYLHGDHLGSVSVTTNASGTANVQEYDPWGRVRSGSIAQTNLNYTGQRLDGTGLLYYHARMYDPVLARFVSADNIAPGKDNPQLRNRYSYVINNPLRYTDPTGHCAEGDGDDPKECAVAVTSLALLGMTVSHPEQWRLHQLQLVLEGAHRLQKAAGWTDTQLRDAITGGGSYVVFLTRTKQIDSDDTTYGRTVTDSDLKITNITFADKAFREGDIMAQITTVHELAHAWDNAAGHVLSNNMAVETSSYYGCANAWDCLTTKESHYVPGGHPASEYARADQAEDWAESVAASVFTSDPRYTTWTGGIVVPNMDQTRSNYVQNRFKQYGS